MNRTVDTKTPSLMVRVQMLRSWEKDKIIYISMAYFITFTWKSKYILYSVSRECYQAYQPICVTNTLNDWQVS